MPFISKDWRSPGETWVKTQEGWEKKKVLENCKLPMKNEIVSTSNNDPITHQPHCHIIIKRTREIAGFNELNEALKRLDFYSAVRDVRRFNYVCALLELLVGEQTTALSGCVQKVILSVAENVAAHAIANQHNPRTVKRLISKLKSLKKAKRSSCWGALLGSQILWQQHSETIERILYKSSKLNESSYDECHFLRLPEECIREILLRFSDHNDLAASAEVCPQMALIVNEQRTWRELTKFYFSPKQINSVLEIENQDWKNIYHKLRKVYGLREDLQYAEMLFLCRYCRCLFWKSLGHPCIVDQCPEFKENIQDESLTAAYPVPPSAFLKLFSM